MQNRLWMMSLVASAGLLTLTSQPIGAEPINTIEGVLIEDGEQIVVDFDLTGLFTGPFSNIVFGATFDPSDPVEVGVENIQTLLFGDSGGRDLIQVREDAINCTFGCGFGYNAEGTEYGPLFTANPIFDPMLDGIFSIGFRANSSAIVSSIFAAGRYRVEGELLETERVEISLRSTATPVPEPGTLALLGAGLVGIGFARRRKKA